MAKAPFPPKMNAQGAPMAPQAPMPGQAPMGAAQMGGPAQGQMHPLDIMALMAHASMAKHAAGAKPPGAPGEESEDPTKKKPLQGKQVAAIKNKSKGAV